MKTIVVITTGGTIAMKYDPDVNGLVPAVSGDDLVKAVPPLKKIANIEVVEYSNVPSGYITPKMMLEIADMVDKYCQREDVAGVVVTHGTDTIEETAYMLGLYCITNKAVCICGAMRGASDMGYDGPANILAAVKTAACTEAASMGVLLVMNDEIHAAAEVTKTHSVSCSTFASPGWGPLGHVYEDGVIFKRKPLNLQKLHPDSLTEDVYLLKTYAGMDTYLFHCLADKPIKGLVVEALGCGNVPLPVKKGIELVAAKGIPVVLATRVHSGRVAPVYSYEGSANSMKSSNIILAGEISGQKARLKLMLALSISKDSAVIQKMFM